MCMHQQTNAKAPTLPVASGAVTETTSEAKVADFVSCGLDRSCPTNVTTHQGQGVRLDQYQSSIREKVDKRRRGKKGEEAILNANSVHHSLTNFEPSKFTDAPIKTDHEFEWYDLDAIRELGNGNSNDDCAIIIGHDFNAGLIFTTERQVLSKEVEVNVVNPSVNKKENKSGQEFEFDLFFWVNGDHSKHGETSDERAFRQRMEELEVEIKSDFSPSPPPLLHLSTSFSSSSSLSSSDDNEAKNQSDSDDGGNFFASWLFEDSKTR